jgi:uncharacterized protein YhbP (UPF0306 family)
VFDEATIDFLTSHNIGVLATVDTDGGPQACTIFYVADIDHSLIFKSRSGSNHIQSIRRDRRAALVVYCHDSTYNLKSGLQLKGEVVRVREADELRIAVDLYSTQFKGAREKFAEIEHLASPEAESTLYRFIPSAYKLTDGLTKRTDSHYKRLG